MKHMLSALPRRLVAALLAGALVVIATPALVFAVDDPSEMLSDPKLEARAEHLGSQLRCLVCQNESIEDSSAGLARDLRRVVREHITQGQNDKQIMDWMVSRYGNFIRLAPPLTLATLLLWGMAPLALLTGCLIAFMLRKRRVKIQTAPPPLTEEEKARLAELTKD